ncbi:alpha/beta fold hydrolase [Niallia sp. NCCP-28]|uniref:alpha/beta fold hydrolase n=1 Tax=Niallia sp. NCCP-28 TaxID=2934712 RepID=UPI0020841301|nr:alpha/beta hydrolase [Niallia sp. NCCP-28]GKU80966.1 alpha/beta hydrolase [Niallia sp. NCCP-28]
MKTMIISGKEVAYQEAGKGKTIILIHGFCGNAEYWENVMPLLTNFHVVAIELRGHGKTSYNGESFLIEDLAKDIQCFLDKKELADVYMFGHSLGGYVTLAFAELFPEALAGFGLIHSTAYPDTEQGKEGRLTAIKKIQDVGMAEFVDGLIPNLFSDDSIRTKKEEVEKAKEIGYKTDAIAAMETLSAMRKRIDRNHIIANSPVPVLLVKGTKDKVVPLDRVASASGKHITAELLETGHMSMIEDPTALSKLLVNFVKQDGADENR